jgi:zinc protease
MKVSVNGRNTNSKEDRFMLKKVLIAGLMLVCAALFAQQTMMNDTALPVDPDLVIGKLSNGLTYYIKENHKPSSRAELRLVVNVGSVQEDDDQQGLAHFTEHMAFNGTKHFKKAELVDYLNSIGMGFANGLNGYTSFDETAFLVKFPTDNQENFRKGFQVLSDWAAGISFDTDELDKERGVIIEEWRGGQGAYQRIFDKQRAVIYAGSKYAERMPIGKLEVLQNFKPETIKRFYNDWYRPDLLAIVAVGDFDAKQVEQLIKDNFSNIPAALNPRPRVLYEMPDNDSVRVVIATDKEANYSWVELIWKKDNFNLKTVGDYRKTMVGYLFSTMLDKRLQELSQLPDPPFSNVFNYLSNMVRSKSSYTMQAYISESNVLKAITALMTEAEKAKRYSFTEAELERAKQNAIREAERLLAEKDNQNSEDLVWNYIQNFTNEIPLLSIEQTIALYNSVFGTITLADINAMCRELITDNNLVVSVAGPDKEGLIYPTEAEIISAINQVTGEELITYDDRVRNEDLFNLKLTPHKIKSEKQYKKLGIKEWKLSNGVKVLLKQTDFMNDEVLVTAFSPGGYNRYGLEDMFAGQKAAEAVKESGVGDFDATTLVKRLTGKIVSVEPFIYGDSEGFTANCSKTDMETMFQLMYLYGTVPRLDEESFISWQARNRTWLENAALSPWSCFADSMDAFLYNNNPRTRNMKINDLEALNWQRILQIYQDRFCDFSDFTFIIVGSFDEKILRDYCERYLANLPSTGRKEKRIDTGIRFAQGKQEKLVYVGQDEKSAVELMINGSCRVNAKTDFELSTLSGLLDEKLRENIRETRSGVYMIFANGNGDKYPIPSFSQLVFMQCAPDRVEELSAAVIGTLDSLKAGLIDEKYVNTVKTTKQKQLETDLKDNNWWKNRILVAYTNDYPLNSILSEEGAIRDLDLKHLQKTARKYLIQDINLLRGVMYPKARQTDQPAEN